MIANKLSNNPPSVAQSHRASSNNEELHRSDKFGNNSRCAKTHKEPVFAKQQSIGSSNANQYKKRMTPNL